MARRFVLLVTGLGLLLGLALLFAACTGPQEKEGPQEIQAPPTPGIETGLNVTLEVSKPPNGTHFAKGQKPVVTVTLKDDLGNLMTKDDFASLNLYMYGPQETTKTVTAVKLLKAETDRTKTPHHFINLITNTDVQAQGNALKYTLQPVSDEDPGTYTVTLYAVSKESRLKQAFALADTQIGTATVEKQIVEREKCASCHLGADSGQLYLHHVDPTRTPEGSPAIDSWPVRTCKSCHNNNGYAAFIDPQTKERVPDQIVHRVHGVHMGEHLKSAHSVGDPEASLEGVFADYTHVEFPANVRNCTKCHVDDRWKTQPSRLACGACHDWIDFKTGKSTVEGKKDHGGGPQANDSACSTCHTPDTGGVAPPISVAHKVEPPAFKNIVELALTASKNGKFYVAGESPQLTVTVKDAATGTPIAPNTWVEPADPAKVQPNEWRRLNLFVSGPREGTVPVLTTVGLAPDATHTYMNNDLRVRTDPAKEDPRITRTSTSVVYQLADVAGLKPGTYTAFVETMPSAPIGGWAVINFQIGTATEDKKVATNCVTCHEDTRMHASYFAVKFEPDICKNCHDYQRQMPGKAAWTDRNAGFGAGPLARRVHGVHFGHYLDKPKEVHATEDYSHTIFPQDVRNCTKCHSADTTGTWKTKPSRLACNACHDADQALAHTSLMTKDPTPVDPWSGDEIETCNTCHGAGRDFSADKVHDISKPYVPPYPREHPP